MKVLTGVYKPDAGTIYLNGQPVQFESPHDSRLAGIEMVYQDLALAGNLHVAGNIFLGRELTRSYLRGLIKFLDHKGMFQEATRLLQRLHIDIESVALRVETLSGGQRQAVAIGRSAGFEAPVLIIDSNATWPDKLTFIGTDNKAGGKLAGDYICSKVGSGGKVAIISGQETAASIADRVAGAQAGLAACGANVVAKISGDHSRAGGQAVMEDILASNPDVQAIFAINDNEALGAAEALTAAGKLKDVLVVGFDANPDAIASILNGEMSASVAQVPANMGGYGLAWGLNALLGLKVEPLIDTGTTLVTAENAAQFQ
jgi:ABC-type uncharacterized transport system ATPase subunit